MFVALLKLSTNRAKAGDYLEGHKAWLKRGFDEGVFLAAGTLAAPDEGGGILAHNTDRASLEARLAEDPFVAEEVVRIEVTEIGASITDPRLSFLGA
ncbi:hypothetical protein NUH88_18880 [Nisaea acidiphila]|uniref:YCII-related domain-containing protein n=1 Tax=Nisaea acidiphila TaxID=1862145 RepID=A0A9J7AVL0_9PROT|nr:YciI family protein [Nisaea acidiphila]UUX49453.1 hypothetical protein NUH88_18880 [Nisaea acidiphila]